MSVTVICGSMFSGKTEELLRRIRRAQIGRLKVQVFKPKFDNRYSETHVESHDHARISSVAVERSREILRQLDSNTRYVAIDEVQFFDSGIVGVAQTLAYRGIEVVLAGLDMDFRGEPFGPMPALLAIAEEVVKLTAICMVCGKPATRSQCILPSTSTQGSTLKSPRLIGASEKYEARCRKCHEPQPSKARPWTHPASDLLRPRSAPDLNSVPVQATLPE